MNLSDVSSHCRLEWRRSHWLSTALCVLALAAVAALWLSDLPRVVCAVGSVFAIGYAGWLLYRESRRPSCVLTWPGGDAPWQVECEGRDESLRHVGVSFRGGLIVLTLADASDKPRRYVWWPDTLDTRGRRALRLAMRVKETITPVQSRLAQ